MASMACAAGSSSGRVERHACVGEGPLEPGQQVGERSELVEQAAANAWRERPPCRSSGLSVSVGATSSRDRRPGMRKTSASRLSSSVGAKSTWRGRKKVWPLTPPSSSVSVDGVGAPVSRRANAGTSTSARARRRLHHVSEVVSVRARQQNAPRAPRPTLMLSARLAEGTPRLRFVTLRFGSDAPRRRTGCEERFGENRPRSSDTLTRPRPALCSERASLPQKLRSTRSCSARAVGTSSVNGCTSVA